MKKFYACFTVVVVVLIVTSAMIGARVVGAYQDGRQVISYLAPDGSGAREHVRLWSVVSGATRYYALFIDGTRWVLTDAGAVSCDAPEASLAWAMLVAEHRADIVQACSWKWAKWAFAHSVDELNTGSWGDYKNWLSRLRVECDDLSGPVWDGMTEERQRWVIEWCNAPERIWTK